MTDQAPSARAGAARPAPAQAGSPGMKWSWRLGRFQGIGVYVHATFVLLVAWVALIHWMQGRSVKAALMGVVFILALFACVVLHEFGHALTAKRYGINTRDITLLPIGGLARLEKMPDEPRQELWVALAGPAVNVVIAAVLWGGLTAAGGAITEQSLTNLEGSLIERLIVVNIFLVLFNMLPAFPMDGGRVLRALLAMRMSYAKATQVAASMGQGIAFLFGFIGLFSNPFLVFIALFVWMGATQEASMAQVRAAISGVTVREAMLTEFRSVSPEDTLDRAVELTISGSQQDFPVVSGGEVVGVLTQSGLLQGLAQQGRHVRVAEAMEREFEVTEPSEPLETALQRLRTCGCRTLPVLVGGRLAGLFTQDNLSEFLSIRTALNQGESEYR